MDIEKLILTKCRVIKRLNTFKFLVEDLRDNNEKEMKIPTKQAMNPLLKENEVVYAGYSSDDKSIVRFLSGTDFKYFVSSEIYNQKKILDEYLPIRVNYS